MGEARLPRLRTDRLILRPWRAEDLEPFAAMNADREVVEYLPGALSRAQSDAFVARIRDHFDRHGFGFWAVEVVDGPPFIGLTGLAVVGFQAAFTPAVEIGWRLARSQWGRGYASEAAAAALEYAFDCLGLEEVVSFTSEGNARSRAVMERLGMTRDPADDFEHPSLPPGHRLRRHVLYRARAGDRPVG